ncbi:beta-mannosidase [Cylas formicarius]|uniref:beta-mannosidase n=1 Tax=Cylas formicarius TaxID=197179 RepID=UPI002958C9EF|nr:beta-mannosidase [Cylas formicarius]
MFLPLRRLVVVFVLVVVAYSHAKENKLQDLGGEWTAKETNYYYEFPVTVPGGVYTDLMKQNILEDIFFQDNDQVSKWVGQWNWTYHTNFTVDADILEYDNVHLVFEGIDTFATIYINDVEVASTNNMFVQYVFDVKSILKSGKNTIVIYFLSPVLMGADLYAEQLKSYRIPYECPADEYRGECHINMIRKMQAAFSWDWGPSFASMGIWKPVYIEAYDETVIRYVVTQLTEQDDNWNLNVDTYFANNGNGKVKGSLDLEIALDSRKISQKVDVDVSPNEYSELVQSTSIVIPKSEVKVWWPNGYGAQPLYTLTAVFADASGSSRSEKSTRIGFRTVELVQDQLNSGLTFYFKVNDVPIFMKGSNEIPINILPELGQDKDTIKRVLTSAQEVHMNMLRVWGGGVYESDYFYDLADELGILIWQDFMFACALYPSTDVYLENVVEEIRHNIKRIYNHPSIAIYSGNNENEGVIADNWYGTNDNISLYKADYVKLYVDTIRTEFDRISHNSGIYVTSSPSNGKETESENYVATNPGNQFYGDVHFYNYNLDPWNSNFYPVPRFCSEYGYQSLPDIDTLLTATNNTADLQITSDFMDHRQHHPDGNNEMKLLIDLNLQLPSDSSENYYKAYIFYSQIYAAQSIKVESEHYRRYRSILDDQGRGYTMGALYWQLNDVWVAPTWSSIDYTGKWKMLHYFAKDFFAPIIVTGHINNDRQLQIYTVSDLLSPVTDTELIVRVYQFNSSFSPLYERKINTDINASESALVETINTDDFLSGLGCGGLLTAKYNCFFYFVIRQNSDNISPENYAFAGSLALSNVETPNLQISSVAKVSDEETYAITLTSDKIALFVWLDSHAIRGKFSENGFLLVEANRTVYFTSESETSADDLKKVLTVTNLKDPEYFK